MAATWHCKESCHLEKKCFRKTTHGGCWTRRGTPGSLEWGFSQVIGWPVVGAAAGASGRLVGIERPVRRIRSCMGVEKQKSANSIFFGKQQLKPLPEGCGVVGAFQACFPAGSDKNMPRRRAWHCGRPGKLFLNFLGPASHATVKMWTAADHRLHRKP